MPLFQASVLKKYLNLQDKALLERQFKRFSKYFLDANIQENIKNSKEEEYQGIFLTELFVKVLGYTLKPKEPFNLVAEYKNETNARKADGAILKNDSAIGVVELKSTKTKDLESIRKQAFDYKANQKDCVYVITSNFEKLRFYINDATEFIEFDLFNLSHDQFELLYLCLAKENIFSNLPLKIKEDSLAQEEAITKEFYKDYSVFKRELYRDLVKRNGKRLKEEARSMLSDHATDDVVKAELQRIEKNVKLSLFKKSQKLIDRLLFIFFAEDRGLLPPNSTLLILEEWNKLKDLDVNVPLYERFKLYFKYLDEGREGTDKKAEIYAYNGGLFKPDTVLDTIELDDELLYKHTLKLANYDFESQVDVNILGHIFENSLNEIESVNAEIEGGEFDKQKSKRKKDGVFYTPKYITKYIVENTVGKLCEEKKQELGFKEEEYYKSRKGRQKSTLERLRDILDAYREWLLQITICDPACGSGAFLNQALDFLINEHNYIDELKTRLLGGGLQFPDIENTVLEKNIFGVDLNEESVEIAKLSLWLRTAQPRRRLNDLSNNIKCGNSLIDSKAVAGDKAFNWQEEFPEIFAKGGFDVVIGNPPYVRNEFIDIESKEYFRKTYNVFTGKSDLYVFFFEKSLDLLNQMGRCGFIVSSKYTKTKYGKVLIKYLQDNSKIRSFIDFRDLDVFKGIVAYPSIILFEKATKSNKSKMSDLLVVSEANYNEIENNFVNSIEVSQDELFRRLGSWTSGTLNNDLFDLIKKLEKKNEKLSDLIDKPQVGIKTGSNRSYIIRKEEIPSDLNNSKMLKEYLLGREVKKYSPANTSNMIVFPYRLSNDGIYSLIENFNEHQETLDFLKMSKEQLSSRAIIDKGIISGKKTWYEYQQIKLDFPFHQKFIVYPDISDSVNFTFANDVLFDMTCFGIPSDSMSILGILNSKLIEVYLHSVCVKARGGYLRLKSQYISKIPLPSEFADEKIEKKVEELLELNHKKDAIISSLLNYIQSRYSISIIRKLQLWYQLEYDIFIKELHQAITTTNKERKKENLELVPSLTKKDEFEWLELFEENKKKAQELQTKIDQLEKEIDQMVYGLYGLTEEEIAIVEGS